MNYLNYMFETLKMVSEGVKEALENPNADLEIKDLEEEEAGLKK